MKKHTRKLLGLASLAALIPTSSALFAQVVAQDADGTIDVNVDPISDIFIDGVSVVTEAEAAAALAGYYTIAEVDTAVGANTTAIGALDYYTTGEVDTAIGALDYYTTGEVDTAIGALDYYTTGEVDTAIGALDYYTTGEVDTALADNSTADQGYTDTALMDYYTIAEVDTALADNSTADQGYTDTALMDYYTIAEVDTALADNSTADQMYADTQDAAIMTDLETNGIAGVITVESDGIHIGPESLVTNYNAVTDAQDLWAENGGDVIDINVATDMNVDGTLTVQSTPTDTDFGINDDGQGVNPNIPDDVGTLLNPFADTTPVYTQLGGATVSEENFDNSGIIAETNGNLTLLSDQGSEETFGYIRAVRNDVYNADQGVNAGLSAQTQNIGGYIDDNGVFVELGILDLAENWDADFVGTALEGEFILDPDTVLTAEQEALLVTVNEIPGAGGNLQVGGDANVDGALTVAGVNVVDTLDTHFGLVSQNITDIADNATDIQANSNTLDVHFGLVSQNITDIAANAAGVAANGATLVIHEGLVTQNITDIAANASDIADNSATLDVHFGLVSQNIADIADNAATLVVHEGLVTQNIADIADNAATLVVHEGLVTQNIADIADNAATLDVHFGLVSQNIADIADNAATLDVHFGLVSQNIADIATNATAISTETARAVAAEDNNAANIMAEATARGAADAALAAGYAAADADLAAGIEAEAGARATADDAMAAALAEEAGTRADYDTQLQANIDAEAAARGAADADLAAGYAAADSAIVSGYMAADATLAASISSNVGAINNRIDVVHAQVEQNTRGIAMVAAMTSPTVREGMENALDFHLSQFDGETGVAASYARRVNENVQLNFAAASTTDFDESVIRAGVSLQW